MICGSIIDEGYRIQAHDLDIVIEPFLVICLFRPRSEEDQDLRFKVQRSEFYHVQISLNPRLGKLSKIVQHTDKKVSILLA